MKEYKAIIIDDERNIREALELMLAEHCPDIRVCGSAASAREGRKLLESCKADMIFLDIMMPEEDGFEFLRSIPKENYGIIFVTAFEEFAVNAIKANAIDYLLKPVHPDELRSAVVKAIKQLELRKTRAEVRIVYDRSLENLYEQIQSDRVRSDEIVVEHFLGNQMVKASDLIYLEANKSMTILHFKGMQQIHATRSLGEFEKLLQRNKFFRIHKSLLVNLDYVRSYSSIDGNYAELNDGTRLVISRRSVSAFRDALKKFINR